MPARVSTLGSLHQTDASEAELAKLNYHLEVKDGGSNVYVLGTATKGTQNKYDPAEVAIKSIRGYESAFKLDEIGFELLQGVPPIASRDSAWIQANHYNEVRRGILEHTGASDAIVVSHNPRPNRPTDGKSMPTEYGQHVHVDHSFNGARSTFTAKCPQFAHKFDDVRWAVINWWQPIEVPATRMPLALCDERSIADHEWREVTSSRALQKTYDASVIAGKVPDLGSWKVAKPQSADAHRWYYVPDMELHEALLIKIFDSDCSVSRRTPHTAFQSSLDHGPERKSVEFRCVAIWEHASS